jgi:hypothetical protein
MAEHISTSAESVEQWKPVNGYDGYYAVSNLGRVMRTGNITNNRTHVGKILCQVMANAGYLRAHLSKDKTKRIALVHGLVAEAFIGPRPPQHDINHINGVKHDNRASNLEYVTKSGNIQHAKRMGLLNPPIGGRCASAVLTENQVREIRGLIGIMRGSDIARRFGISPSTVSGILKRHSWKHIA